MAGLFDPPSGNACRLLDAGAGIGSLSAAFLDRLACGVTPPRIKVDLFEIDEHLRPYLVQMLDGYKQRLNIVANVRGGDFVETAVHSLCGNLFTASLPKYTHAILNPPYKKIRNNSLHRVLLRQAGIETVNLYSAFVALSLSMLEPKGQLVAIIPRSFCNGPYYRPFRQFVLKRAAIRHIHLFGARNKAFKDDNVLQENIIIMLERGATQKAVTVTTSTDDSFVDLQAHTHPFTHIVLPDDHEHFIHIPTSPARDAIALSDSIRYSLADIGVTVSTGPVVDFRLKEYLRGMPEADTVPLLYPSHFTRRDTDWPKPDIKKPNAIQLNSSTEKWLYPIGFYCVVRRFSTKEEKRRIVASVVQPDRFSNATLLGFENHLNVFHTDRRGLPRELAYGLATFLNTTAVDINFRTFNGHTQVNATDLRLMKYPNRTALITLGKWALQCQEPTQAMIDKQLA